MDSAGDDLDDLIRRVDPERWLSSRFMADPVKRADVIALYAYDHELARAPKVASSSLLGEIRLTWWREVLDEAFEGRPVRHHPTAQAIAAVISRRQLPRGPLEAMIDARYRELDATPMTALEALDWARDGAVRQRPWPSRSSIPRRRPNWRWQRVRPGHSARAPQRNPICRTCSPRRLPLHAPPCVTSAWPRFPPWPISGFWRVHHRRNSRSGRV